MMMNPKSNIKSLREIFVVARFIGLILLFFITTLFCRNNSGSSPDILLIDDFNSASFVNKRGYNSGYWQVNPIDYSQYCRISFDPKEKIGKEGYSLRLDLDIDSDLTYTENIPNTAFNGYYTKLGGADLTRYNYLIFYIKGDQQRGFTRSFKIELQNLGRGNATRGSYTVEWITTKWEKYIIPLWEFRDLRNRKSVDELTIVFDRLATGKVGTIYIDNIYFARESSAEIK